MGPQDTNLYGSVHGGAVMRLIDEAAAAAAGRHAGVPALTVSVEGMTFLAPTHAGDLVSARAQVRSAGRTSMTVDVVVTAERWNDLGPLVRVASASLVFVAVDQHGRPQRVPTLVPATDDWLVGKSTEPAGGPVHFVPSEVGQRPRAAGSG